MFVFTAKLNRKKAVVAVIVLALLLAAAIILVSLRFRSAGGESRRTETQGIANAVDAARYLNELGWQVDEEPLEVKHLVIPRAFTGVWPAWTTLLRRAKAQLS